MKNTLSRLPLAKLRHRLRHDRGAVLVEAAFCIPLLLLVIMGAVEAGLAWEAKSATVSGVRTGTLRAASDAENPSVDFRVLQSVIGEVGGDDFDRIVSISIFEVTGDPDTDFTSCLGAGTGNCIVYDATDISNVVNGTLTEADFGNGVATTDPVTGELVDFTCDAGFVDSGWCSGERIDDGDVQLAVGIEYTHEWFTNIFPFDSPTFTEYVTSATFTDGGVDIDPGTPVGIPMVASKVVLSTVDFSGGSFDNADVTANSIFDRRNNGRAGRFDRTVDDPTITLSNQPIGTWVCVTFDYRFNAQVEAADDFFVTIDGNQSVDLLNSSGAQTGSHTHCSTSSSDPLDIVFEIDSSADDERFFIDNLSIEVTEP